MLVTKNNGSLEPLDLKKIEEMVLFAFKGSVLDPNLLLQKINISFYDKIPTNEIQNIIIHEAKLFITEGSPDNNKWALICGRLETAQLHGDIYKNTKFKQENFREGYKYLYKEGYYDTKISDDMLSYAETLLNLTIDFEQPSQVIVSLKGSYLIKSKLGYIEYPQWAIMADSLKAAINKDELFNIYDEQSSKRLSPATPPKKNYRTGGNTASCFSLATQDSLEGIMKSVKEAAQISKAGGGLAVYVGKIRPSGSDIQKTVNASTHINKWVKFFDQVAGTVDQLGSRSAAISISNDWFHLDFLEFMEVSTEDGGDLRLKSFDIIPQFILNNYLLKKIKAREDVYLVNNYECITKLNIDLTELIDEEFEKNYNIVLDNLDIITHKKVSAYKLWVDMWVVYFKIGKVNITNKDNINNNNYLKEHYIAQTANLCVESFSINTEEYSHTCNLMSINLAEIVKDPSKLRNTVRMATDLLDRNIDTSKYPIASAYKSAYDLRNTGIGVVGGADWLAYKNMTYNKEGIQELSKVMESIAYYAYEKSMELASEKGAYPLYKKANYNLVFNRTHEELNKRSLNGYDWVELFNKALSGDGFRNFLLLSPAPNAGTGVVMGVSPNFLPVTSTCHFKDMKKITPIIVPPYADEKGILYRTKGSFDGVFFLDLTVAMQDWVDTGVSNEIGINPGLFNMEEFSNKAIEYMLEGRLKTIYYMSETSCLSCAN